MLELKNIVKEYVTGEEKVTALRGINMQFRKNEFVSVLGPSGCGKTTLLNIIGGLDSYTDGDLVIDGISTQKYKDRDWDSYRNHSIGFVFQSYNLIPHQSVLANVELALTLSGVSRAERRRRAVEALQKVGLGDQLHKRPAQMSGGQMQRVAIARALVNRPSILLADEPTGALDTETSVQIMDLLAEIARDKLVIMVTHNPDLAGQYSSRIIRLLDGQIIGDTNPCTQQPAAEPSLLQNAKKHKTSMSFMTALGLSFHNLLTKKGRTVLTAFAGSIGIIGIALILSLSNGIQSYIDRVQEDTLSGYPISIEAESVDMTGLVTTLMGNNREKQTQPREEGKVYSSTIMYDMMDAMNTAKTQTNDLTSFKVFLENDEEIQSHISAVQYGYDLNFNIYTEDPTGEIVRSDIGTLMEKVYGDMMSTGYAGRYASFANMKLWEQMLPGNDGEPISDLLVGQYDILYGRWPQKENEVILFISKDNALSDMVLYAMGLKSGDELADIMEASMNRDVIQAKEQSFTYEELCRHTFKLLLPGECWQKDAATGGYRDLRDTDAGLDYLYHSSELGITLKIVGIARPNEDSSTSMMGGAIGYLSALTDKVMTETQKSEIVLTQQQNPDVDVFTNLPFADPDAPVLTDGEKETAFREYAGTLTAQEKAEIYLQLSCIPTEEYLQAAVDRATEGLTRQDIEAQLSRSTAAEMQVDPEMLQSYVEQMDDETLMKYVRENAEQQVKDGYAQAVRAQLATQSAEQLAAAFDMGGFDAGQWAWMYDNFMPSTVSEATYEENMKLLGWAKAEQPATVNLYAATFADKDAIAECITRYNEGKPEAQQITYTDYVALLMSSITTIINAISYVLVAFVAISLVVSSIMIGIITYISVLERTKEIGILRAIGASKKDVSRVFKAETFIEGLISGALGIGITLMLLLPINAVIHKLTDIRNLNAALPALAGVILVVISVMLTVVAGLLPARVAAKKDPVVALRSE